MAYSGPFSYGDRVQLTDAKRRHYTVILKEGGQFHSHKGIINHDDIVGMDEGSVIESTLGSSFLLFRHLMVDHVLSMPRGAAVIYPKDAAQILVEGDIFMGARVLEAGAGSGALSMSLLRAVGPEGHVYSYEIREDHLEYAVDNVEEYFGARPEWWSPRLGDLGDVTAEDLGGPVDRIILDMLEPWENLETVRDLLIPGGVFMTYVATVPQLMKVMEGIRELQCFTEPKAWESLVREWKVEGLATRPEHRMNAHTAFLIWTRRLADGVTPPRPQRRARK
ncbi:tRNA (adenine-N1)-methyltransferase [Corynebacterium accolens]|jgi:tRNA (adenine57-N1/adenine58-N1)-methyltransferase catalytic subunit|uniref:tRNA (adenine(58)-N(1))-methyltransferase TrmI n=1 Tax=Corynebacterium accolens TaxID=38284 RepID=A0AAP4F842_9CORY|nr:tRNA (adenine-N1)-methyltransferase [Corynebacterium accolens]MDK4279788.1 tRNA (adenine-N1)-methyltransferase [Corynebacterium accolens]MDK4331940.1 tRNA (adenine-N1)-methyltransferase [Corynebacterium accolens]MDK4334416.1 tRNA (adenine-N1)-methyltransferase [Corynebacterium accolens]MDK8469025.1 tRNA (adenine-N1)-methyltransferase [Corynebacterium accolens]MDK8497089.1 tRNA (adenine-N1)-methyltransferase [Corynebacterium accolens]